MIRKSLVIVGGAETTKDMVSWPRGIHTAHGQTAGKDDVSRVHSLAAGSKLNGYQGAMGRPHLGH